MEVPEAQLPQRLESVVERARVAETIVEGPTGGGGEGGGAWEGRKW